MWWTWIGGFLGTGLIIIIADYLFTPKITWFGPWTLVCGDSSHYLKCLEVDDECH